jgi:hypothetical protein
MTTFHERLINLDIVSKLRLLETYFTFDPAQYNQLFADELEKLIQRVSDRTHRQVLERMRGFNWVGYVAASVRNAGFRDYRARQEATADVASKLLMGTLFSGFDERTSGPIDLRFKQSVANGIRNIIEKERNRKRNLPAVAPEYEPSTRPAAVHDDEQMIADFRRLLRSRLGDLALAVFDLRMSGGETKSLVGSATVGNPSRFAIKQVVLKTKALAQEFAQQRGDPVFLRNIERAVARESETLQKRLGKSAS